MKIAVVGCGGIGGVVCAVLASRKADVVCIEANEEASEKINRNGLKLKGKKGKYNEKITANAGFSPGLGKFDVIAIAVKSGALRSVFSQAKDYLSENGFILTLSNGLEIINIAKEFPSVKVAGGAVEYNSIMKEYGKYHVTANGGIVIGSLQGVGDKGLQEVKSLFGKKIKISITENIIGVLWSKLLIVCGVTGLGGISALRTGKLLRSRTARKLFYKIVAEGREVAERLKVQLEPFGRFHPDKFADAEGSNPLFIRWLKLMITGIKRGKIVSNIQIDLQRGRKTEVDWLNGAVVSIGAKVGVETPVNREIVRMVKEIEKHKREMSPDNLHEIWEKTGNE
ncbi:MAG: 2-dehydropantoate 2-reductase [Spirochaetota bacterium]|nr:MAG: 2-dehydropantoate 2-reductase [Spirochaetota bacterium]